MTNSQRVCLGILLSLITACVSDDAELAPDAGPGDCDASEQLVEMRRLCLEHCDATAAATGCEPRDLEGVADACRETCIVLEVDEDCVDEAARHFVCLSQVPWACEDGAEKPAPPAGACLLTEDVLAACLGKGGRS
jgi:hypothetical protein